MIVGSMMTKNPVYVSPDLSVNDARELMTKEKIGRLPVLDRNNRLVGIVTKKDLVRAGPSAATTLDMYEISYLLSKLKVEKVMERKVIPVEETEVVEEAARIMADNDIGCLPVMKGILMVGIITEKDLFRVFVDMFGARHPGVRITFSLSERPGELAKLTQAIADRGGNIVALVTGEGDDAAMRRCTCKIGGLNRADAEAVVKTVGAELEDIREGL